MTDPASRVYDFVLRGVLTDEALDRAGRSNSAALDMEEAAVAEVLSLRLLDDRLVADAQKMAIVYTVIAAFENSVRELVRGVLLEAKGEGWWTDAVSEKVRQRAEKRQQDEDKARWHTQRGTDPIYYTMMADLVNIMRNSFV